MRLLLTLLAVALLAGIALLARALWSPADGAGPAAPARPGPAAVARQEPARPPVRPPEPADPAPDPAAIAPEHGDATAEEPPPAPVRLVRGTLLELPLDPAAAPAPAPGLEVEAHGRPFEPELLARAPTGPGGSFELALPPDRTRVWLRVAGDEAFRELREVALLPAEGALELELARAPRGVPSGRVGLPDGRPLEGVELRFEGADSGPPVRSDAAGRFRPPGEAPLAGALLAGHGLLRHRPARRAREGGWEPLEVVLAPAGELDLEVVDETGAPVAGVRIEARPDRSEPLPWRASAAPSASEPTGAEGRTRLAGLPAGVPLTLTLVEGERRREALGQRGGELVLAGAPGEPLTAPAGGVLELRATLPPLSALAGRVLAADGAPAAGARVRLLDPHADLEGEARADADGRFRLELRRAGAGPLALAASSADGGELAWRALAASEDAPLELRLAAAATLRGSVSTGEEDAASFRVRALPPGSSLLGERSPWGPAASGEVLEARLSRYGEFELGPLPAGPHDLFVHRGGAPGEPAHRFEGVRTGSRANLLILPTELPARLLLHPLGAGGDVREIQVVLARWYPRVAMQERGGESARLTADRLTGWPGERWGGFAGVEREELDSGTFVARSFQLDGATAELPPTPEGWYWIGVRPVRADGAFEALVACGPVHLGEGLHELGYARVATGALAFELEREGDELLSAMLVDASGAPLPLPSAGGRVRKTRELRARDRLILRDLPAGEHFLRIGTERELTLGRARAELRVTVEPAGTTRASVVLP